MRPRIGASSAQSLSRFFAIFSKAQRFQTTKSTNARASESSAASWTFSGSATAARPPHLRETPDLESFCGVGPLASFS